MRTYLNAGFGELLSQEDIGFIRSVGFNGIRQDVKSAEGVQALVENALATLSSAIFVVDIGSPVLLAALVAEAARNIGAETACVIEIGNEIDATAMPARDFGRAVRMAFDAVRTYAPIPVVSGGVTNTSTKALDWLEEAMPEIPQEVGVGYHTYRDGMPHHPHHGFNRREDEFARLRQVAGARYIWHTEGGWHTALRPKPFPLCWQKERLDDIEVGRRLVTEMWLNQMAGALSFCVYQLNDSVEDNALGRYGLRAFNGDPKPQAWILHGALGGH